MNKAIVWFTTDLRMHDNEALIKAIEENDEVLPVYCIDPRHFADTNYGTKKTGSFRAKYLLESLKDLDKKLRSLGSGLLLLRGRPELVFLDLIQTHGIQKIYTKKHIAHEELSVQNKLIQGLESAQLIKVETNNLYALGDLPFRLENLPSVFTDYRRIVEKNVKVRGLHEEPLQIKSPRIDENIWPNLADLGLQEKNKDKRAAFDFVGGEHAALSRLDAYLFGTHSISTYKETRNGLIGENYSSKFSAALALGCLSPKKIYHEIAKFEKEYGANESTYWLIFELLWRDYFHLMMEKYPKQFFRINGINPRASLNFKASEIELEKWKLGQTADEFVNANMLELKQTGFMSNRGRQNVASYLCHDLKIDWRLGAAYFEEMLVDYDVSSNWCNWAYIAGVGNDPRNGRAFNLDKQAKTYDPDSKYRALWLGKEI
jgi:deoxyribodipyrimidine photo-lyase